MGDAPYERELREAAIEYAVTKANMRYSVPKSGESAFNKARDRLLITALDYARANRAIA